MNPCFIKKGDRLVARSESAAHRETKLELEGLTEYTLHLFKKALPARGRFSIIKS